MPGVLRQRYREGQRRRQQDDRRKRRKEDQAFRRLGGRQPAGHDDVETIRKHRAERIDVSDGKDASAWPRDDEHADETGKNRQPAPPARPLAEQRSGERGDDHRPEEIDRRCFGELQRLQRQKIADRRAEQEAAAQDVHRQVSRTEALRLAPAAKQEQHHDDMHRKPHPDRKERRDAGKHDVFCAGVEEGENNVGDDHVHDRRGRRGYLGLG